MAHKAPGKHYREGMSLVQLMDLFPTEEAAHDWFVEQRWSKTGRHCPRCGSTDAAPSKRQFTFWCPTANNALAFVLGPFLRNPAFPCVSG